LINIIHFLITWCCLFDFFGVDFKYFFLSDAWIFKFGFKKINIINITNMFNIIDRTNMIHLLLTCRCLLNSFGVDFRIFCFLHGGGDFKDTACLLPLGFLHLLEFGSSWSSLFLEFWHGGGDFKYTACLLALGLLHLLEFGSSWSSFWCFLFKVSLSVCIWKYCDHYWIIINE
jgi:hypothetical protein